MQEMDCLVPECDRRIRDVEDKTSAGNEMRYDAPQTTNLVVNRQNMEKRITT